MPFLRRLLILCTFCLYCSIGLSGCQPPPAAEHRPYLLTAEIGAPKTFNYYLSQESSSRDALAYTLEGLTQLDPDTLEWIPSLAESWKVFDDGLRIVFTMRSNLRWSDGVPLTAADVAFTYNNIIFNEAIPTSSRDVMRIGESGKLPQVNLLSDRQLEFVLPEPFAPFFQIASSPVMPAHIFREAVSTDVSEDKLPFLRMWGVDTPVREMLSSGPYELVEYVPNQRITYRANPYYWKTAADDTELPRIQTIIQGIVASQDTQLIQFRSGDADLLEVRGSDFQLLKQEEESAQFNIFNLGPTLDNSFIAFNLSKGSNPDRGKPVVNPIKSKWFNDVNFRRAVSYALDRQTLIDSVLRGLGEPQFSVISSASPFHLSPAQGLPIYNYSPAKARETLLDAGYQYDNAGLLRDRDGNQVRFTLNTNVGNTVREAIGAIVKSNLADIGMTVDFVPIEFNTLVRKISGSHEWEAVMLSFGGGGTEPNSGANIWRSTGALHMWNPAGLPGAEVYDWEQEIDRLFIAGVRELDFDKRKQLYDSFQTIVQEQLPLIGTVNRLVLVAMRDRLEGADPRPILGTLWNLDELAISDSIQP
ncbi:MAG: ABC transporter substrate-binding protein [Cyanobacteria bacterium P01_F01_bin.33]